MTHNPSPAPTVLPARLVTPTPKAARRVIEFFTAQIDNDHTPMAYRNVTRRFADWCDARGIVGGCTPRLTHAERHWASLRAEQRSLRRAPPSEARQSAVKHLERVSARLILLEEEGIGILREARGE
jgi:hypothetical protein